MPKAHVCDNHRFPFPHRLHRFVPHLVYHNLKLDNVIITPLTIDHVEVNYRIATKKSEVAATLEEGGQFVM